MYKKKTKPKGSVVWYGDRGQVNNAIMIKKTKENEAKERKKKMMIQKKKMGWMGLLWNICNL